MRITSCLTVLAAGLALMMGSVSRGAVAEGAALEWPSPAAGFARSGSGAVAVTFPELKQIHLYPRLFDGSLEKGMSRDLPDTPTDVVALIIEGKGRLAVLCPVSRRVVLLDDQTLEEAGRIELRGTGARNLLAAQSPSGGKTLLYYMLDGSNFGGSVGRVDPGAGKELSPFNVSVGAHEDFTAFATSSDGRYLYGWRPTTSPTGQRCFRIVQQRDQAALELVFSEHADAHWYLPDPFGTMVAAGMSVFTADHRHRLAQFPEVAVGFLPRRPVLLANKQMKELVAYSTNDFTVVGRSTLPLTPKQASSVGSYPFGSVDLGGQSRRIYSKLLTDEADERAAETLALCTTKAAIILPIASLVNRQEVNLQVRVSGPRQVFTGSEAQLQLEPLTPGAQIALAFAPQGLKLDGQVLRWTPQPDQVGDQRIELKVSAPGGAGASRVQRVTVNVSRPAFDLEITPHHIALTPDGRRLVAYRYGAFNQHPQAPVQPSVLRVFDAETMKLLAEQVWPRPQHGPALGVDDQRVILPLSGSNAFDVFKLSELNEPQRVFTPGRAMDVVSPGNGRVYVKVQPTQGGKQVMIYDAKTLQPLSDAPPPDPRRAQRRRWLPRKSGENWSFNGALYNHDMTELLLLMEPSEIPPLDNRSITGLGEQLPMAYPFDTHFNGQNIVRTGNQLVGQIELTRPHSSFSHQELEQLRLIVPGHPLAVALWPQWRQEQVDAGRRQNVYDATLLLYELDTGRKVREMKLMEQVVPGLGSRREISGMLTAGADRLYAAVGSVAYVVERKEVIEQAGSVKPPLHFVHRQEMFVLDPVKPTLLQAQARGGQAPITHALATPRRGLGINAETGEVIVEPAPLMNEALAMLRRQLGLDGHARFDAEHFRRRQAELITPAREQFERLTGREAQGVPVAIATDVVATDARQQTTTLRRVVLLEVPRQAIDQFAAAAQKRAQEQPQPITATRPATATDAQAIQRRLETLEKTNSELREENARLRGENQVLREMLDRRNNDANDGR